MAPVVNTKSRQQQQTIKMSRRISSLASESLLVFLVALTGKLIALHFRHALVICTRALPVPREHDSSGGITCMQHNSCTILLTAPIEKPKRPKPNRCSSQPTGCLRARANNGRRWLRLCQRQHQRIVRYTQAPVPHCASHRPLRSGRQLQLHLVGARGGIAGLNRKSAGHSRLPWAAALVAVVSRGQPARHWAPKWRLAAAGSHRAPSRAHRLDAATASWAPKLGRGRRVQRPTGSGCGYPQRHIT